MNIRSTEFCTVMASDMDPIFKRALRLLHSKSKDAEEQLRMMFDDAVKQRYGNERTLTNYLNKKESSNKPDSPRKTGSGNGQKENRKDADKKHHEKLNEGDIGESSGAKKKPGNEIEKSNHSKQLLAGSSTLSAPEKLPLTNIREMVDREDIGEDDLALEILEDDLACVICRGMDIGARNQMVECVECKSLYHQECHQPPVAHTEINDPRSAWYCATCTEAINSTGGSSNNLEKHMSGLNLTGITPPQSADTKATLTASATKSSSSNFTSSSKSCGSLSQASAKPLSSSCSSSKSVVSTSSNSKVVMPNINIVNAEKKLQIMKKKAAKQQEKRKHSK